MKLRLPIILDTGVSVQSYCLNFRNSETINENDEKNSMVKHDFFKVKD